MSSAGNLEVVISAVGAEETAAKIDNVKGSLEGMVQGVSGVAALSSAMDSVAASMKELGTAMSTYITVPLVALGTAAVWAATRTDELKQALQNVGGNGAGQFATLGVEADKLGLGVEAVAKAAIKLEVAGISNQTTLRVINGIGEAVRKMGGGDAQFTPIISGLERIAATGHIASRQIKTMETQAPEIKKVLLDAFGTDVPKALEAMGLTTEEFFRKFADSAAKLSPHVRTIKDSFTQLKNDTETSLGKLGDALVKDFNLTGVLDSISKFVKDAITAFTSLPDPIRKAIEVIAAILVVGGPLMLAIAGIITIMPILAGAFAIGFWPVTGIILGIGLLVAAGTALYQNFDMIKASVGYLKAGLEYVEVGLKAIAILFFNVFGMIGRLASLVTKGAQGWKDYGHYLDETSAKAIESTAATYKLAGATAALTTEKLKQIEAQKEADRLREQDKEKKETKKETGTIGGKTPEELEKEKEAAQKKADAAWQKYLDDEFNKRQGDVKIREDVISFKQLEADNKAAAARILNQTRLLKMGYGETMEGVLKGETDLKAFMNTLSIGTLPSIVKMGEETAKSVEKGGMVSIKIANAIKDLNAQITEIVKQGSADMMAAIGTGLGKAFESGNFQDLGKGLLSVIGGIMTKMGIALIGVGSGIEAFQSSLESLDGPLAIGAGIALVAAGEVFTSVASSAGSSHGGGMSASASSNNSGGDSGNMNALSAMIANSNKMQLTTKIAGSDLIVIMNRANNSQNRTS